jgi:VanZ family protein
MDRRGLTLWAPVLAWAALIFALSSIPSLSTGLGLWDTVLRKGAHITEYAVLGALLLRALSDPAAALVAGIAYATSDEIHQHFVRGRHASPVDVGIDTVGLLLGILALRRARAWTR